MIKISENYRESVKQRIENSVVIDENSCWIWQKGKQKHGYGVIGTCENYIHKSNLVHRLSFYLWKEDPKNKMVLHKCCRRECCNPDHLYIGDQKDNMRDRLKDGNFSNGNRKGENHPLCSLTEKTVLDIRRDFQNGDKPTLIAQKYGIRVNHCYDILKRKSWKHI